MGPRLAAAPPAAARRSLQHHARRQAAWDCLPSLQQSAHAHSLGQPSLPARPRPSRWHSESLLNYRRAGTESVVDSESAAASPAVVAGGRHGLHSHGDLVQLDHQLDTQVARPAGIQVGQLGITR